MFRDGGAFSRWRQGEDVLLDFGGEAEHAHDLGYPGLFHTYDLISIRPSKIQKVAGS